MTKRSWHVDSVVPNRALLFWTHLKWWRRTLAATQTLEQIIIILWVNLCIFTVRAGKRFLEPPLLCAPLELHAGSVFSGLAPPQQKTQCTVNSSSRSYMIMTWLNIKHAWFWFFVRIHRIHHDVMLTWTVKQPQNNLLITPGSHFIHELHGTAIQNQIQGRRLSTVFIPRSTDRRGSMWKTEYFIPISFLL